MNEAKRNECVARPSGSVWSEGENDFRLNDMVCAEMLIGVPDEKRIGRLVQVRKGCGQFNSHVYIIRLASGDLMTFENVMIRHLNDKRFVEAFYLSNGRTPPTASISEPLECDFDGAEYTIGGKWPEAGFIVDDPAQPQPPGAFAITIISPNTQPQGRGLPRPAGGAGSALEDAR